MSPKFESIPSAAPADDEKKFVTVRRVTPEGLKEEKRYAGEEYGKAPRIPEAVPKKTAEAPKAIPPEKLAAIRESDDLRDELQSQKANLITKAIALDAGSPDRASLQKRIALLDEEIAKLKTERQEMAA